MVSVETELEFEHDQRQRVLYRLLRLDQMAKRNKQNLDQTNNQTNRLMYLLIVYLLTMSSIRRRFSASVQRP